MRFRSILAAVAALTLSGCYFGTGSPPASAGSIAPAVNTAAGIADAVNVPAPSSFADRTTLDETGAIGFESAIAAAADLGTLAVRSGVVPRAKLPELRDLVRKARAAVRAVRAAYDTGNATSYRAAVAEARASIDAIRDLANGGTAL